jgi:hypothetical protein
MKPNQTRKKTYSLSELHASSSLCHYCSCVHDQQLHNYLTLLCCKQINGKSATSMSRWMYAKANLKYDFTSVTLVQKMYVPPLLWTLVARVVKMDMQQWENCRIKCYSRTYAQTQSSHTIRAVASPKEAVRHWIETKGHHSLPSLPMSSLPFQRGSGGTTSGKNFQI